jgi:hypothetical protein
MPDEIPLANIGISAMHKRQAMKQQHLHIILRLISGPIIYSNILKGLRERLNLPSG